MDGWEGWMDCRSNQRTYGGCRKISPTSFSELGWMKWVWYERHGFLYTSNLDMLSNGEKKGSRTNDPIKKKSKKHQLEVVFL